MRADEQLVAQIARIQRRLDNLVQPERGIRIAEDNVASPPTDAQLTTAFGSPHNGFVGAVDDAGAGSTVWLVVRVADAWWYEQLTKAV